MQKRIIRIIMNSSRNASCRQLFKDLNILQIQSQYIYSILLFVTKHKDQFLFIHSFIYSHSIGHTDVEFVIKYKYKQATHKYIKSIQGKLLICTYLQQTQQYTKRASITQELRFTIIYQQPSKIYLMIRINLS